VVRVTQDGLRATSDVEMVARMKLSMLHSAACSLLRCLGDEAFVPASLHDSERQAREARIDGLICSFHPI
jgi:hypothetical protein